MSSEVEKAAKQLELERVAKKKFQYHDVEVLVKELRNFNNEGQTRTTRHHFTVRLNRIRDARKTFLDRHFELITLNIPDNDDYIKDDIHGKYEELYVDVVATIMGKFDQYYPSDTATANTSFSESAVTYQILQPAPPPFKLPDLTVPIFDGVYTEWPAFYDAFLTIHNHEKLTVNNKFTYLREALTTNVKSMIGYLSITQENYNEAWAELIETYDNKRVLFSNYMDKLLTQPTMAKENASDLQLLHDVSRACVHSISKLGIDVSSCGEIFTHLLLKKLPTSTQIEWGKELGKDTGIPTFKKFIDFVNVRYRTYEAMFPQSSITANNSTSTKPTQSHKSFHVTAKSIACALCKQPHPLRLCPQFLQLAITERREKVNQLKVCYNCLGHPSNQSCISKRTCKLCSGKHNTLLHYTKSTVAASSSLSSGVAQTPSANNPMNIVSQNLMNAQANGVLLSTALIDVPDVNGQFIRLRALVDQGSQKSVITERAAQRLKLPKVPIAVGVLPMGETQYKPVYKGMNVLIHSIHNPKYSVQSNVAIMPSISSSIPSTPINHSNWQHLNGLPLADPHFGRPGQIDLLLAGDVYGKIIQSGLCKGQEGEPITQHTSLGWILSGEIQSNHFTTTPVKCFVLTVCEIGDCIKHFHDLEEMSVERTMTQEDEWVEQFYDRTTVRQPNGKFMVRLPFKFHNDPSMQLGATFVPALTRFQRLQQDFNRNEQYREQYSAAINEYIQLNQSKFQQSMIPIYQVLQSNTAICLTMASQERAV